LVGYVRQLVKEESKIGLAQDLPDAIYRWACPNCGLSAPSHRLALGIPCERCIGESYVVGIPRTEDIEDLHKWVYEVLKESNTLKDVAPLGYSELVKVESSVEEFSEMFSACVGREPWSLQKMWARRVIMGSSFALIAPTGVGKTTFGIIMSIFLASRRSWKSVIIVPTIPLVDQLFKRAVEYVGRSSLEGLRILSYHSRISQHDRREILEKLSRGEFDILITTSAFFRSEDNISLIRGKANFFFIDDVDAILRGGKILDHVLSAMGIDREVLDRSLEVVDLKAKAAFREDNKEILEKISGLKRYIGRARRGDIVLVISSATGRARGRRIKILREIFGFEIGARHDVIRNVADLYYIVSKWEDMIQVASDLIKRLGSGGLVYVPKDLGISYAEEVSEILSKSTGMRVAPLTTKNIETIEGFARGEVDVVVGVSTYYGVAVRGIDLPDVIRYAVFLETPRHRISLNMGEIEFQDVPRILELAVDAMDDSSKREELVSLLNKVLRIVRRSSPKYAKEAFEKAKRGEISSWAERVFKSAVEVIGSIVSDPVFLSKLEENPYTKVERVGDRIYVYIPDWATYIQASGRTSRLYVGGISKGLSVILERDPRLLKGLERRLKMISDDISLKKLEEEDISKILQEIDRDRESIRKARQGILHEALGEHIKHLTRTVLVIVESPNKARTIASFFGKPSVKELGEIRVYEASLGNMTLLITASGGHLYDLAVDDLDNYTLPSQKSLYGVVVQGTRYIPIYTTIKKCRSCGNQFTNDSHGELKCPICGSSDIRDSRSTIEALRRAALEVDEIYIATDPDTEGEKIAFDLYVALMPYNNRIRRIEFHEVTRRAFINALKSPRNIDLNRVRAQLVRRIEDRWIGFILSQKVTDYLRDEGNMDLKYRLSAGRVQTPVLGWVVTSTRGYKRKKFFVVKLQGGGGEPPYILEIPLAMFSKEPSVGDRLTIHVDIVDRRVEELGPLPPYTTDAMLVDISHYLKIPAPRAMAVAQDLFELGLITYHRTDSTRISDYGIEVARSYLLEVGRQDLLRPRRWGEGGAHEAIRPTRPVDLEMLERMIAEGLLDIRLTREHMRVYDLIFRRFIASQSAPARIELCAVEFEIRDQSGVIAKIASDAELCGVVEKGFMEFYSYPYREFPKGLVGKDIEVVVQQENFRGERLYTPGDLIRMMRGEGIGRPSTYAKIVDIILRRYVVKSLFKRTGYLASNKYGRRVYEYLSKEYSELVNIDRTRKLEEKMDQIERGSADYIEVLSELYSELKGYRLVEGE